MRLIDANKLGLHFNDWQLAEAPNDKTGHEPKEYTSHDMQLIVYETIGDAIRAIDEAPTVDAVPIKHGRWVGNERHTSCSICGQTYCVPDGQDGHLDMTFYKYCPNCGADMRDEQDG